MTRSNWWLLLSKFNESLLASNHLFKDTNTIFISFFKSLDLGFLNIKLVPSANRVGLGTLLIVSDTSFTYREEKVRNLKLIPAEYHVL
jgi:hypothetical protein